MNCDIQKRANFDFIKNILILLLQHGLDCHPQHILQSIMDMVQNARRNGDILCIYELSLLILQYGGNPNIALNSKAPVINDTFLNENGGRHIDQVQVQHLHASQNITNANCFRNSFRNNEQNYVLHYFIMLILRKEFILTDPDKHYLKIFNLFNATMHHDVLYSCLKSLNNLFVVQVPNKLTEYLINHISKSYCIPRSLKEICRVKVYETLSYKLAQNINRLNLPPPIKEYLLYFE